MFNILGNEYINFEEVVETLDIDNVNEDVYSREFEEAFEDKYGYMPDEDDYRISQQVIDFKTYWMNNEQ